MMVEAEVNESMTDNRLTVTVELPAGFVALSPVERERALEGAMTQAFYRARRVVAERMHATYGRGPLR